MSSDKFAAAYAAAEALTVPKPGGPAAFGGMSQQREQHAKQSGEIRAMARSRILERMEEFVREARLKFLKPKVTRTVMKDSFEANGLYVTPVVQVASGAELVPLDARWHLQHVRPTGKWHLPFVSGDELDEVLARAALGDVLPQLEELQRQADEHWASVGARASEIEREYRAKSSPRERKEFRRKMAKALRECRDLVDEDPDFIMKVMKLDFHELETLAKFARRNPADMAIAEVEDVRLALDELRVAGVMES